MSFVISFVATEALLGRLIFVFAGELALAFAFALPRFFGFGASGSAMQWVSGGYSSGGVSGCVAIASGGIAVLSFGVIGSRPDCCEPKDSTASDAHTFRAAHKDNGSSDAALFTARPCSISCSWSVHLLLQTRYFDESGR